MCSLASSFIAEHTINNTYHKYNQTELDALQSTILKETGQPLSTFTISQYIDFSEDYCNITKTKSYIKQPVVDEKRIFISDNFSPESKNLTHSLHIPLGSNFMVNINSENDENALNLYDLTAFFFFIEPIDNQPNNHSYFIRGLNVIPLSLLLIIPFSIYKWRKFRKNVEDYYRKENSA